MKRRLRKKLYLEEFATYGFYLSCELTLNTEAELDSFIDEVIELVESCNLSMGGGGGLKEFSAFITPDARYGSPSPEAITKISDWFGAQPSVSNVEVSDLIDAQYGPFEE